MDKPNEKSLKYYFIPNKAAFLFIIIVFTFGAFASMKPVRQYICENIGLCYKTCDEYTGLIRTFHDVGGSLNCESREAMNNRGFINSLGLGFLLGEPNKRRLLGKACFSAESNSTECK